MLLKLVWIVIMLRGKYRQEKAKNAISERLDSEFSGGACSQTPLKVAPLALSQLTRLSEKSAYGPASPQMVK